MEIWAKDFNRHLTKGEIQGTNISKHMKKYSTALVIRWIQIKSTIRYTTCFLYWLKIKTDNNFWVGYGAIGTLSQCGEMGKIYQREYAYFKTQLFQTSIYISSSKDILENISRNSIFSKYTLIYTKTQASSSSSSNNKT